MIQSKLSKAPNTENFSWADFYLKFSNLWLSFKEKNWTINAELRLLSQGGQRDACTQYWLWEVGTTEIGGSTDKSEPSLYCWIVWLSYTERYTSRRVDLTLLSSVLAGMWLRKTTEGPLASSAASGDASSGLWWAEHTEGEDGSSGRGQWQRVVMVSASKRNE